MSQYKDTLNLPKTAFAMKANLAQREPGFLKEWQEKDYYKKMINIRKDKTPFILHDGPPYANGTLHVGHALNKVLKDIIVKSKAQSGFYTPYVPGWDCHGLPIELNVEKKHGKAGQKLSPAEFRQKCRDYAQDQIENQKKTFQRLGVAGQWDDPYKTMDFKFEADIVRSLAKIIDNGHLAQGFKPVHWCYECGSALAEAEVEYKDKTSPSIDVAFDFVDVPKANAAFGTDFDNLSLMIWTTTPWTIPANQAVTVHPELTYAIIKKDSRYLVVAKDLTESLFERYQITDKTIYAESTGDKLEKLLLQHPFYSRQVPVILGLHVTTDAGTGAVHTAPSHGEDDFNVGKQYDLPIESYMNDKCVYSDNVEFFAGQFTLKANDSIVEKLDEVGQLIAFDKLQHSYPHCWRHKTPILFRATPQWFISMDAAGLRENSLKEIEKIKWVPGWGEERIKGMVETRPDWCISRQRTWCMPMTIFIHRETDALHPNNSELMERVAKLIEEKGLEAWYDIDEAEFLGDDAKDYRKVTDTLDVWFDSGVTHACVLDARDNLHSPADLYLEGSDQHRGWFNSSLMTSVAMKGEAPYKAVLTHGYTVDGNGRKMSKSIGNIIEADKMMNTQGADVLRLWASAVDYKAEVPISDEILKRVTDTYRRIRNTIRYLLSNLFDFDPATNLLALDDMLVLDRLAVLRTHEIQQKILGSYDEYQFHLVYQTLHHFCSMDMGGFYLDIIKDRQYTCQTESKARRSCQSAMYHILRALLQWVAPVITFTAEEAWTHCPGKEHESVLMNGWYQFPASHNKDDFSWDELMQVRDWVNVELEAKRNAGDIRGALDADVKLKVNDAMFQKLQTLGDELRFLLITSSATLDKTDKEYEVTVTASSHEKCERCWHKREDVGQTAAHATLCARCVDNVDGAGESRSFV